MAVTDEAFYLVCEMTAADDNISYSVPDEKPQLVRDEWLACDWQYRFGQAGSEGSEPGRETTGKQGQRRNFLTRRRCAHRR